MDDIYSSLRLLIENSLDGIIVSDIDNKCFVMANSVMKNWLGYTNDEFSKILPKDIHPIEIKDYINQQFEQFGKGSTNFIRELPVLRKDGTIFYADLSGIQYSLLDRTLVLGIFKDITPRLLAEKELRASERRFQLLFEQAAMGVALLETETGYFLNVNKKFSQITGYSIEELSRTTIHQITCIEDLEHDQPMIKQLLSGEIAEYHIEKRYIRKDNKLIWVRESVSGMWKENEEPHSHIAIVEDISKRKEIENQLAESEERFKLFMQYLPAAAYIKDQDGRALFANSYLDKYFGAKEWIGQDVRDLFPGEVGKAMYEADMKALELGYQKVTESLYALDSKVRKYETQKFRIPRKNKPDLLGGISIEISENQTDT